MDGNYDPLKKVITDPENYYGDNTDFITEKDDGLFHIGQSYEDTAAETIVCKICGGNEFNIGSGCYFTAIRCTKCEYEICIHEG